MSSRTERLVRVVGGYYVWVPLVFFVFFGVGYFRLLPRASDAGSAAASISTANERLPIYVGSSTCGASNVEDLRGAIATLRQRVREWARRDGRRFVSVGVAKDANVRAGLAHLAKFGDFDEVMTGRSWANIGVLKYLSQEHPGPRVTPQILVVDRYLSDEGASIEVLKEVVRLRRVGLQELREWVSKPDEDPWLIDGEGRR